MTKKPKMPSPAERPDIYDDFDYADRPKGYQTGVRMPAALQAAEKKKAVAAE